MDITVVPELFLKWDVLCGHVLKYKLNENVWVFESFTQVFAVCNMYLHAPRYERYTSPEVTLSG